MIEISNDGKGKYQSYSFESDEWESEGPDSHFNFSLTGYGEDWHEARDSFFIAIKILREKLREIEKEAIKKITPEIEKEIFYY